MIRVKVGGVSMSGVAWVVLLESLADERVLPMAIGTPEAQSILYRLNDVAFPRPLTHDLMRNVLDELGYEVVRVEVTQLRDETFYALLHLQGSDGRSVAVDSRPSDAVALALRFDAPIFVAEAVMDSAGIVREQPAETAAPEREKGRKARSARRPPDPLEVLRDELAKAIAAERYEEAARLRDQLNALSGHKTGSAPQQEEEP